MSGGGGSSSPTSTTVTNTSLPDYLQGPVSQLAGQSLALTNTSTNPFQSGVGNAAAGGQGVQGTTVAGFTPLQQQAMQGVSNMQVAPQLNQATGMTGLAGLNAQNIAGSYNPFNATNQYSGPQASTVGINQAQQVGTQNYTGANVDQYMSPYMQDVVNQQKTGAVADYARNLPQLGAAATRSGAVGGTRDALVPSEANRNLQGQLQNIQATGSQAGFQNAQQQFNAQQQANLQAQGANQQAGLTTQGQALQQAQGLNQFGLGSAQANAQYGLGAQQLNSQQQQFLSNLGLQGNQQLLGAGAQMGQLGQNLYGQQSGILSAQNQMGTQQQNLSQNVNNALAQNYQNYLNYPYAQQAFLSGILHGTSPGALGAQGTTSQYQQAPNTAGQLAGIGTGLAGLFGASGG